MLDQGVENKKQLEKVKEVFKEREEELVEDIKTLQVEVENKDKIINVLKRNGIKLTFNWSKNGPIRFKHHIENPLQLIPNKKYVSIRYFDFQSKEWN